MPEEEIKAPVPLHEVVNALLIHGIQHDVAWWLANLDRKVWEMERRLERLEKSDVTG